MARIHRPLVRRSRRHGAMRNAHLELASFKETIARLRATSLDRSLTFCVSLTLPFLRSARLPGPGRVLKPDCRGNCVVATAAPQLDARAPLFIWVWLSERLPNVHRPADTPYRWRASADH